MLFAGLLDEWHSRYEGFSRAITTELLQAPTPENGNVAITKATARAWREDAAGAEGSQKEEFVFEGHGDASPGNVGKNIVPHIIRMSETRGKARALRDAVNVGVTALEELSDEEPQAAAQAKAPARPTRTSPSRAAQDEEVATFPATVSEKARLRFLVKRESEQDPESPAPEIWEQMYGAIDEMPQKKVLEFIDHYMKEEAGA